MENIENSEFITPCDNCHEKNGDQRCGKCKCVYYCSRDCQAKHWSLHKVECKAICKQEMSFAKADKKMEDYVENYEAASANECAICLERLEENALTLPCSHSFCLSCMKLHHKQQIGTATPCPLCRSTSNLFQYVYTNATNFVNKARREPARKAHFCKLARRELRAFENEQELAEIKTVTAEVCFLEEDYETAVSLSEAAIDMQPQETVVLGNLRNIVSSYMALNKFTDAMRAIQRMFKIVNDPNKYIHDSRFLFHSCGRTLYGLCEYEKSIDMGSMAIEANRHYEGVHEYVARSYQALGRWNDAILIMRRAVRYETPWDLGNVQRNEQLLETMLAEQEAANKCEVKEVLPVAEEVNK